MPTYNLHTADELWASWKATVPRSSRLDDRLHRLLIADLTADASILEETPTLDTPGVGPGADPDIEEFLDRTSPTPGTDSEETTGGDA